MSGRMYCGWADNTEPATKVDGLLWGSPMLELLIWYNGAWRPRGGSRTTINPYGVTTPVPTPAWAAVALCGPGGASGPNPDFPAAMPYINGQCWFNTTSMRLCVRDTGFWIPIP